MLLMCLQITVLTRGQCRLACGFKHVWQCPHRCPRNILGRMLRRVRRLLLPPGFRELSGLSSSSSSSSISSPEEELPSSEPSLEEASDADAAARALLQSSETQDVPSGIHALEMDTFGRFFLEPGVRTYLFDAGDSSTAVASSCSGSAWAGASGVDARCGAAIAPLNGAARSSRKDSVGSGC